MFIVVMVRWVWGSWMPEREGRGCVNRERLEGRSGFEGDCDIRREKNLEVVGCIMIAIVSGWWVDDGC